MRTRDACETTTTQEDIHKERKTDRKAEGWTHLRSFYHKAFTEQLRSIYGASTEGASKGFRHHERDISVIRSNKNRCEGWIAPRTRLLPIKEDELRCILFRGPARTTEALRRLYGGE